jgi:hypothetical protein
MPSSKKRAKHYDSSDEDESSEQSSSSDYFSSESDDDRRKKKKQNKSTPAKKVATRVSTLDSGSKDQSKNQKSAVSQPSATSKGNTGNPKQLGTSSSAASAIVSTGNNDITKGNVISTESEAKKLILSYLTQQNRPYSAIQINDNLHNRIQKSTVSLYTAVC